MTIVRRTRRLEEVACSLKLHPVAAVLGPRQCGKTTLARRFVLRRRAAAGEAHFFDLEDETDLARLAAPKLALEGLKGLVVIDEVQRRPALFETLRVLADRRPLPARFLILGSASRDLIRQGSESLAGRVGFVELPPLSAEEAAPDDLTRLWVRGGFPPSFLAASEGDSRLWRRDYISTFLERDVPSLGFRVPPAFMRRFWTMLAHYHGQIFNASEIGRSLGLSDDSIRRYLDILTGTFMVRRLPPWHENLAKRQVKSPKIYFRDSGIFHGLLGVWSETALRAHPKLGASWEGWALEEVLRRERAGSDEAFFWATHGQAELDLLIARDGRRAGFEFKFTDAPRLTPSMRIAMSDLKLDELTVIFPGDQEFPLAAGVRAAGLRSYLKGRR